MFEPASLIASFIVGGVGYVAFSYGKRQRRLPPLAIGIVLLIFPYFVDGALAIYGIAAVLLALMWVAIKQGF